jgi:pantoate kinase
LAEKAHIAEVRCKTGLGTVGAQLIGGCVLSTKPGGPGYNQIDRIPLSPNLCIISATYGPILTKSVLSDSESLGIISEFGRSTLRRIIADPCLESFMEECKRFAFNIGLCTDRIRTLIDLAEKNGAIGATQNMIGEAVHAVVSKEKLKDLYKAFTDYVPKNNVLIADIDLQGPRLLG